MGLEITTNAGQAAVLYRQAPTELVAELVTTSKQVGLHLQTSIVRKQLSGQALTPRTGTAKRSVESYGSRIAATPSEVVLRVGFDLARAKYMRIHELGGTIRPVHAKRLAIPLPDAKTAAGVPRFTARELMQNPQAFGFQHAFVAKSKGVIFGVPAQAVVRKRRGALIGPGAITPLFALKASVTLPARAPLAKTLDAERAWILKRYDDAIGRVGRTVTGRG